MTEENKEIFMGKIIELKGKVKFNITIDPSVWIFDDRKIDLDTYFDTKMNTIDLTEEYTKSVSQHWDREIIEGATIPPTNKTEKRFLKEKLLNGTFGMILKPFIENAEPLEDAKSLTIITVDKTYSLDLETGKQLILCFSNQGKPLQDGGPVHAFFHDRSNNDRPIKNIIAFQIE
jgi:hypothetical protein